MGMAALRVARSDQGVSVADLDRMGIWRLRELARQTHPEHVDEAAREFVRRILDMEVERRLVHAHDNIGWHSHSPMAPGFAPGGTDIAREPLALAYDRGIRLHRDHEAAKLWIAAARLTPRRLLAVLIQARKLDRRVQGAWGASYDKIAANLGLYAQQLGFGPVSPVSGYTFDCIQDEERETGTVRVRKSHRVPAFKNGQAIKDAANSAKAELILQAKAGVL